MDYIKKFILLKEVTPGFSVNGRPLSGIARAEKTGTATEISLSLINFAAVSDGAYYAAVFFSDGKKRFYALGKNPVSRTESFPADISGGFACLIAFCENGVTPVAFGAAKESGFSKNDLAEFLNENLEKRPPPREEAPLQKDEAPPYDDLALATENYYLKETGELPAKGEEEHEKPLLFEPPFGADDAGEKENEREEKTPAVCEDAAHPAGGAGGEGGNYYERVKEELDKIFSENPEEDCLKSTVPQSRWVKIEYAGGYYLVGVVEERKKPKYICYGVPAKYSPYPPKELAGYCTFIPLSVFEMKGDGFWMLFQSAETGECVHMGDNFS